MHTTTIRLFVVDMTDASQATPSSNPLHAMRENPRHSREGGNPEEPSSNSLHAMREERLRTDPFIAGVIDKLQREVKAERRSQRSRAAWSASEMWQRAETSPIVPSTHFDYEVPDCDDLFGIDQGTSIDEIDFDF